MTGSSDYNRSILPQAATASPGPASRICRHWFPQGEKGAFDAGQVHPAYVMEQENSRISTTAATSWVSGCNQGYFSSIGVARMRRGRWIS